MYSYIKGIVTDIMPNSITIDNNGIGYLIYTPNPFAFTEGDEYKIYIYHHIREDEISLYGFKTVDEKTLFLKLIDVKGLGPKMALPIIATGSVSGISDAINRENILYLKKFPKIGDKLAKQMILDLKGKIDITYNEIIPDNTSEIREALKSLGYKDKDITGVIARVNKELTLEQQVKEALKFMLK